MSEHTRAQHSPAEAVEAQRSEVEPTGSSRAAEAHQPDSAEDWHRLHPLSPLIRGWIVVLAVLGVLLSNVMDDFFRGDGPGLNDSAEGLPGWASMLEGTVVWVVMLLAGLAVVVVLLVIVALFSLVAWWFTRYQITETHVRLRQGALTRQERQTRLDRVQALDIQRPLGARIFGLAELSFEVADAGESAVVLRYLTHAQARRLRSQLLSRSRPQPEDSAAAEGAEIPLPWAKPAVPAAAQDDDGEQLLLRVPVTRVLLSWALSPSMVMLVLVGGSALAAAIFVPEFMGAAFAGWIPAVVGLVVSLFQRLEKTWGFSAYRTDSGLRLRYGLLNTVSQTVPTGRIQALKVNRPVLWRRPGWSRVAINVAGYGDPSEEMNGSGRTTLIPVATDEHLAIMLAEALGADESREAFETVRHGLRGDLVNDPESPFTVSPRRAVRIAWIVRRRRGFAVTAREVVTIDGRLSRTACLVPHGKIQSMEISRGLLARWLDLSEVSLHSIQGPVSPTITAMDRETAERFVAEQSQRARQAHTLVGAGR